MHPAWRLLMTKSRRLNVRLTRDELIALEARANLCGQSPQEYLRTLLDIDATGGATPLLNTLLPEVVFTAVGTHHLVTLTGDQRDLPVLTVESDHISKALGVGHVR